MITAGIDAGSRTIKAVIMDGATGRTLGSGICDQGIHQGRLASSLLSSVLRGCGVARRAVRRIVATGYGREHVAEADATLTEITCHAAGVRHRDAAARTIIDIGGQDSKVIRLDAGGGVRDFAMNDRCAAGTGRFLEVVSGRFQVSVERGGTLALRGRRPAAISSTCVVFAETEIIGLMASGEKPENILAGVQRAIASRIASMAGRRLERPVVFTGGVARVPGMSRALEKALACRIRVARDPQFAGALGAAVLALGR